MRRDGATEGSPLSLRRTFLLLSALALAAAVFAACRGTSVKVFDATVVEGRSDEEQPPLHYGGGLPVRSFDPNGPHGWCEATALLHARLFAVTGDGRVQGDLAQSHELAAGGRELRIHLHPDATFHDGAPVFSQDVVATFEALRRHERSEIQAHLRPVERVEARGERDVVFVSAEPFPELPEILTEMAVLPARLARNPARLEEEPIGAGPYRLFARDPDFLLFVRHRGHHRGVPEIAAVALHTIEDDRKRADALARGLLDLTCIKHESLARFADRQRFQVRAFRSGVLRAIPLDVEAPGLEDARVRRALSALVDREEIVRRTLGDVGRPAYQVLAPECVAFDPELDRPDLAAAGARALLDEAGFVRGGDGLRRCGDVVLRVRLLAWQGEAFRREAAELVTEGWRREGIDAAVVPVDHATYTRLARDLAGEAEGFLGGWGAVHAPVSVLTRKFTRDGAQNRTGFHDAEVARLLAQAATEPRLGRRVELVRAVERRLRELVPWIPLVHTGTLVGATRRVRGLDWEVVDSWYELPQHLGKLALVEP